MSWLLASCLRLLAFGIRLLASGFLGRQCVLWRKLDKHHHHLDLFYSLREQLLSLQKNNRRET